MNGDAPGPIRAPRGAERSCKGWHQEAALRMLMNNLDPEVAERPGDLVVYGGGGKAARDWACYRSIVETLRRLEDDETLLVQSGKPVGVFRTHAEAPRVLIANANLVPRWATWDEFRRLDALGLTMYGQMTAGSWIYIATQGIIQGTYETFAEAGHDGVERGPRPGRPAGAPVHDEVVGTLGDLGIEVVHQHPQGGLLAPALAAEPSPPCSPNAPSLTRAAEPTDPPAPVNHRLPKRPHGRGLTPPETPREVLRHGRSGQATGGFWLARSRSLCLATFSRVAVGSSSTR